MKKTIPLFALLYSFFVWHGNAQSLLNDIGVVNSYQVNYPANFSTGTPPGGIMFTFKVKTGNTNTGSSDLKLNSYPAYSILKNGNFAVQAGDIKTDAFVTVIFDGANWQMLSVAGNPSGNVASSGNAGYIPRFASSTALLNSTLQTDGTWTSIGIAPTTNYLFRVDQPTSVFPAIYGLNSVAAGTAIWGYNNNVSAGSIGINGQSVGAGTGLNGSNTGTGYGVYGLNNSTGYAAYFQQSSTGYAAAFMGGNVGIGTPTPLNRLDVSGNMAIGAYAGVNTAPANSLIVSGRVGIGIVAPSFPLDVIGVTRLQNDALTNSQVLYVGSASTAGTGSNSSKSIFIQRSGANVNPTHEAIGIQSSVTNTGGTSTNIAAHFSASGATNNYAIITGGGNVGIGTATPQNRLDVSSNMAIGAYAGVNTAPANSFIVSGNVGIGTATPALKLDVRGSNATATTASRENLVQIGASDAASPLVVRVGIKTDATAANRYGYIEALATGPENLIFQPQNGNVGIGTTNVPPNARLAIRDGHWQSQQSAAPTFTPGSGAGTTPTISLLNATDVAGTVSVTMGAAPGGAANVCTINFNKSYTTPPIVVLTPANAISAQTTSARQTYTTSATGGFTITFGGSAALAGNVYIWNYIVIETQ